jgi:replicative DNA helicase
MKTKTPPPVVEEQSCYPAFVPAEREILACLLDDSELLKLCFTEGLIEHDFSLDEHRKVFAAVCEMHSAGIPVSFVTVCEKLGDVELVARCIDAGPILVKDHVRYLLRVLAKKRRLRALAKMAEWLSEAVSQVSADPDELAQTVRVKLGGAA